MLRLEKMGKKARIIEEIDFLRQTIIQAEQVFTTIYQKKFAYIKIGALIGMASQRILKNSLKKKLLKRMNANPNLLA